MKEDKSFATLFTDLSDETFALVRKEVELAKVEISEKVEQAQRGVTSMAAGAFVAYAGFLVLLWALTAGLHVWVGFEQPWVAPLIVGLVVLAIGIGMLTKGRRNLSAERLEPRRTEASLRRDADLAKEHVR
ncbi:phage holin family protein [Ectothiorhodospiraceae bacterium 2226]|nr:phage holin family protein [Ectothiorhodospiraceae bacterium 2226]